jgi:hypothetical protein
MISRSSSNGRDAQVSRWETTSSLDAEVPPAAVWEKAYRTPTLGRDGTPS